MLTNPRFLAMKRSNLACCNSLKVSPVVLANNEKGWFDRDVGESCWIFSVRDDEPETVHGSP